MPNQETKPNFLEDFLHMQMELPSVPKDTENPFYHSKYASLENIAEKVYPILHKYNFVWFTLPSYDAESGEPILKYTLAHISGDRIEDKMRLLLKSSDPQAQGSALTFARRYALANALGLVTEADDDGNATTEAADKSGNREMGEITDKTITEKQLIFAKKLMIEKAGVKTAGDAKRVLWHRSIGKEQVEHLTMVEAKALIDYLLSKPSDDIKREIYGDEVGNDEPISEG